MHYAYRINLAGASTRRMAETPRQGKDASASGRKVLEGRFCGAFGAVLRRIMIRAGAANRRLGRRDGLLRSRVCRPRATPIETRADVAYARSVRGLPRLR